MRIAGTNAFSHPIVKVFEKLILLICALFFIFVPFFSLLSLACHCEMCAWCFDSIKNQSRSPSTVKWWNYFVFYVRIGFGFGFGLWLRLRLWLWFILKFFFACFYCLSSHKKKTPNTNISTKTWNNKYIV